MDVRTSSPELPEPGLPFLRLIIGVLVGDAASNSGIIKARIGGTGGLRWDF
jgi:hypothetical protein